MAARATPQPPYDGSGGLRKQCVWLFHPLMAEAVAGIEADRRAATFRNFEERVEMLLSIATGETRSVDYQLDYLGINQVPASAEEATAELMDLCQRYKGVEQQVREQHLLEVRQRHERQRMKEGVQDQTTGTIVTFTIGSCDPRTYLHQGQLSVKS